MIRYLRCLLIVLLLLGSGLAQEIVVAQGNMPAQEPGAGPDTVFQSPESWAFRDNWPNFRGAGNIGVAAATGDFPTSWSLATGHNVLWKTNIPVQGKSSPVIWDRHIFLSGSERNSLRVVCFDRLTGRLLWNSEARTADALDEMEAPEDTGLAASSPATDGKRVYAMFATGALAAFDFDGAQVWMRDFGIPDNIYGHASSLLVYDNVLIVLLDQGPSVEDGLSRILGLDCESGKTLWSVAREVPNSWSSPALIQARNRVELIVCGAPWVIAYDPRTGTEHWRVKVLSGDVAPSPAFGGGLIFVTNEGSRLSAIRPGGSGDVTQTNVVWTSSEGLAPIASPVSDGRRVLQTASGGLLTCFDAKTGKLLWDNFLDSSAIASPILVGDLIYLAGEDGVMRIFESADAFRLIGSGDLGEPISATPAFADHRIYLRGQSYLFCLGKTE